MNKDLPNPMLPNLSARLVTDTPQRQRDVTGLNEMLSRSLIPEDARQLKSSSFASEAADLFAVESSPIDVTSETLAREVAEPEFRAIAREVPVRSTQLNGSLPLWAGGAAVERTVGPLTAAT